MRNWAVKTFLMSAVFASAGFFAIAETLPKNLVDEATIALNTTMPNHMGIGVPKVESLVVDVANRTIVAECNWAYTNVPFTKNDIERFKQEVLRIAGEKYSGYAVKVNVDGYDVSNYLPEYDKMYARKHQPFVQVLDDNRRYKRGLDGNIVALWQSHGWYFEPKLNRWEWQRARIWQTVEDLYTQSYVLPFLVPMLENAGAYVMSPRERDVHKVEVIVDNDGGLAQNGYMETGKAWGKGGQAGFAYNKKQYVAYENPFSEGTYRQAKTVQKSKNESMVSWSADMPEAGDYAVYVSYKSLPESVEDAVYTVNSLAGKMRVKVNQKMGGGTWIYIGKFPLAKGVNRDVVTLSNLSSGKGVVTADAVKIGGGMGNIARRVERPMGENIAGYVYDEKVNYDYQRSRHPRFTEGARYWMQWSGVPDSVYSQSHLLNDYTDDYRSRGLWVNWLAGGSQVLPNSKGLNIPVDIAFAFHSDAGNTPNDSIIGTLGIYMTNKFGKYADGTPRNYSRLLTNAISTNICNDVRAQFEPNWTRRGMWDKSYYEARVPEVPTMLLELLSHHNFSDMKYGLDPSFRFTVSRAVYKGMLEFIAKRDGRKYEVQPLPVNSMAITESGDDSFLLSWKPTTDTLTVGGAMPVRYAVEERVGKGAFREVALVDVPYYMAKVNDCKVHSFRVIAINEGGRSFPSETLACGLAENSKGRVMVVNGFTRVSAPDWFESGRTQNDIAGFWDKKDHGVPYVQDISYIGSQFEFRRGVDWSDDDSSGFGASNGDYENDVIAGNTFDYPSVHGEAILQAGYSFTSCSVQAIEDGLNLAPYCVVDLILGKQKEVQIGRGAVPNRYAIFSDAVMSAIKKYTKNGGNMLVSGAFVASDIWDKKQASAEKKHFATDVLGYRWRMSQAEATGGFCMVPTALNGFTKAKNSSFCATLNDSVYCVESPDGILPSGKNGTTVIKYADNNMGAAVAAKMKGYKTVVVGFPIETIENEADRTLIMKSSLEYLQGE